MRPGHGEPRGAPPACRESWPTRPGDASSVANEWVAVGQHRAPRTGRRPPRPAPPRNGFGVRPRICVHRAVSRAAIMVTSRSSCPAMVGLGRGASQAGRLAAGDQVRGRARTMRDPASWAAASGRTAPTPKVLTRAVIRGDGLLGALGGRAQSQVGQEQVGAGSRGAVLYPGGQRVGGDGRRSRSQPGARACVTGTDFTFGDNRRGSSGQPASLGGGQRGGHRGRRYRDHRDCRHGPFQGPFRPGSPRPGWPRGGRLRLGCRPARRLRLLAPRQRHRRDYQPRPETATAS